jgi:hypothetical protein
VAVEAWCGQDMDPVDRHALRLVNRRGVAVIEVSIVLEVECDGAAGIKPHRHAGSIHGLKDAQGTVLDAEAAVILEEQDTVAGRKLPLSALDMDRNVFAQRACFAQLAAGKIRESGYVRCAFLTARPSSELTISSPASHPAVRTRPG